MFFLFIYFVLFQTIHHHHNASTVLPSMSLLSSLFFANFSHFFPIIFVIIVVAIAAHQRLRRWFTKCASTHCGSVDSTRVWFHLNYTNHIDAKRHSLFQSVLISYLFFSLVYMLICASSHCKVCYLGHIDVPLLIILLFSFLCSSIRLGFHWRLRYHSKNVQRSIHSFGPTFMPHVLISKQSHLLLSFRMSYRKITLDLISDAKNEDLRCQRPLSGSLNFIVIIDFYYVRFNTYYHHHCIICAYLVSTSSPTIITSQHFIALLARAAVHFCLFTYWSFLFFSSSGIRFHRFQHWKTIQYELAIQIHPRTSTWFHVVHSFIHIIIVHYVCCLEYLVVILLLILLFSLTIMLIDVGTTSTRYKLDGIVFICWHLILLDRTHSLATKLQSLSLCLCDTIHTRLTYSFVRISLVASNPFIVSDALWFCCGTKWMMIYGLVRGITSTHAH